MSRIILFYILVHLKSIELQEVAGIKHRETFQRNYLDRLLEESWLERTIPEKPSSRLQKYRITGKGRALMASLNAGGRDFVTVCQD